MQENGEDVNCSNGLIQRLSTGDSSEDTPLLPVHASYKTTTSSGGLKVQNFRHSLFKEKMSEECKVVVEKERKSSSGLHDWSNLNVSSCSSSGANNDSENTLARQLSSNKLNDESPFCQDEYSNFNRFNGRMKRKKCFQTSGSKEEKSHNLNSNNNKKRKFATSSKGKKSNKFFSSGSNDDNPIDKPLPGRRRYNRKHSFQLSSIRYHPPLESRKRNVKFRRNTEYGQRLIAKNGTNNLLVTNPESRLELYSRYVSDLFTTLLDSSWTWVLITTSIVYISHWLIFGGFYLFFELIYENREHQAELSSNHSANTSHGNLCVSNVYDFRTAFLYSLESETSIGYGYRTITTRCPPAVLCLVIQCIVSAIFDTWVIGMCFARLARPDARCMTTMFSKTAVVCERDGKRCLLIRFSNLRKSLLLSVTVKGRLITWRDAQNKEKSAGFQRMLEQRMVVFSNESSALLTQPIDYCHEIDANSPLYDFRPDQFNSPNGANYFELICIVTGTLESTGLTMQAQTSYLSSEVLYGYRFKQIVSKCPDKGSYVVDFKHFHSTYKEPNKKSLKQIRFQTTPEPLIEEEDSSACNNNSVKTLLTEESVV